MKITCLFTAFLTLISSLNISGQTFNITVEKSGDGKSEETAICILTPGEVLQQLEKLATSGPRAEFNQKMKQLSDGSIRTIYKIVKREVFVKLVGGYFF